MNYRILGRDSNTSCFYNIYIVKRIFLCLKNTRLILSQMREHLRQDGYSFDNNDRGLLPDNLYVTRYFNGSGDDFEDGRIMFVFYSIDSDG